MYLSFGRKSSCFVAIDHITNHTEINKGMHQILKVWRINEEENQEAPNVLSIYTIILYLTMPNACHVVKSRKVIKHWRSKRARAGDKIEKNEMGWACGAYGWGEGVYRVLVGKPVGKRPLGRPRRRWVDNIRMDLREVGCTYMDWIGLAQDRDRWRTLMSAVMNLRVPWNAVNFLTNCKPVSFSRRTLHHGVSK